jgi:hypothetical protein
MHERRKWPKSERIVVISQLWERREDGMLKRKAYNAIVGVTGGLSQWADRIFYGLGDEEKQREARRIFTELVHLGDEKRTSFPIPVIRDLCTVLHGLLKLRV